MKQTEQQELGDPQTPTVALTADLGPGIQPVLAKYPL